MIYLMLLFWRLNLFTLKISYNGLNMNFWIIIFGTLHGTHYIQLEKQIKKIVNVIFDSNKYLFLFLIE